METTGAGVSGIRIAWAVVVVVVSCITAFTPLLTSDLASHSAVATAFTGKLYEPCCEDQSTGMATGAQRVGAVAQGPLVLVAGGLASVALVRSARKGRPQGA